MCQSKAQGGRRCRAHNCAAEHRRALSDATKAQKKYDDLGSAYAEKLTAGTVTDADRAEVAAAMADWENKALIERFSDPKSPDWYKRVILPLLPEEYRHPASGIADGIIAHQQAAAKAAGEARTAKMFDRDAEAAAFDEEADEERGKAARLADALRGAFYDTKSIAGEAISDALAGSDDDKSEQEHGVFRSFLVELLEAADGAIAETAEALAAGVGVTVTRGGGDSGAADDIGQDPDQDQGESQGDGQDLDHSPTAPDINPAPTEIDAADDPDPKPAGDRRASGGSGVGGDLVSTDVKPVGATKVKTGSPTPSPPSKPATMSGVADDRRRDDNSRTGTASGDKQSSPVDSRTGSPSGDKQSPHVDSSTGTATGKNNNKNPNPTAAPHRSPLAWLSDKLTAADATDTAAPITDLSALTDDELLALITRLQGHRR